MKESTFFKGDLGLILQDENNFDLDLEAVRFTRSKDYDFSPHRRSLAAATCTYFIVYCEHNAL